MSDLEAIQQKEIELKNQLVKIQADLDALSRVKRLFGQDLFISNTANEEKVNLIYGDIAEQVLEATKTFTGNFTSNDIIEIITSNGYECNASSVAASLAKLRDTNKIEVVIHGRGRKPYTYRMP